MVTVLLIVRADRGISFIGHDEHIGSRPNSNFLGVVELIGEFEPCLAHHLDEFGEKGPRKPSHLLSIKCEEVIVI